MKKFVGCLFLTLLLNACSFFGEKINVEQQNNLVFDGIAEKSATKSDVYNSMARAAKYNVDAIANKMLKQIKEARQQPAATKAYNVFYSESEQKNQTLDAALMSLDKAVLFGRSVISESLEENDANVYKNVSANLALSAIALHKKAMFADRNEEKIRKIISKEEKVIKQLEEKEEKLGALNDQQREYLQRLREVTNVFKEIYNRYAAWMQDYDTMTKNRNKNIKLEGRRFYEISDFDVNMPDEKLFAIAMEKNDVFKLAKKENVKLNLQRIMSENVDLYPYVQKMAINGYTVKDEPMMKQLQIRAKKASEKLLTSAMAYERFKNTENKNVVLNDLIQASLVQIATIKQGVIEADHMLKDILDAKKNLDDQIKKMEKNYRLQDMQKVELLHLKAQKFGLLAEESMWQSQRAILLRSLYFALGFNPLEKRTMFEEIAKISQKLIDVFNKDVPLILKAYEKKEVLPLKTQGWAEGDNWLENLMEEQAKVRKVYKSKKNNNNNKESVLQLGAFEHEKNAQNIWKHLSNKYKALAQMEHKIVKSDVAGKLMNKLQVFAPRKFLHELCNEIKSGGDDCFVY